MLLVTGADHPNGLQVEMIYGGGTGSCGMGSGLTDGV